MARIKGKYDSKLLGSEEMAEATRAFHFERPEGFTFTPGKSIDLFLPENFPGASDDRQRSFSLASAPHEDGLTIATRMRKSAYKEPLAAAHPGAGVRIVGPTGTMSRPPPDMAQASEGFEKCHFATLGAEFLKSWHRAEAAFRRST